MDHNDASQTHLADEGEAIRMLVVGAPLDDRLMGLLGELDWLEVVRAEDLGSTGGSTGRGAMSENEFGLALLDARQSIAVPISALDLLQEKASHVPVVALLDEQGLDMFGALDGIGFTHFLDGTRLDLLPANLEAALQSKVAEASQWARLNRFQSFLADHDHRSGYSVLLVDISRYDIVRRSHGEVVARDLVRRAARRMENLLWGEDLEPFSIMRQDESSFALVLSSGLSDSRLDLLAQQIVEELARPFEDGRQTFLLTANAGAANGRTERELPQVLARAQAALDEAKRPGADRAYRVNISGGGTPEADSRIDQDLRRAIEKDEIAVFFQPQFDIRAGRLIGVEALARWEHHRLGMLGASALFAVAERSAFAVPLSRHIQQLALAHAAQWPDRLANLRLSINILPADIGRTEFTGDLLDDIQSAGFDRNRLTVEITESGLMADVERGAEKLDELRDAGIRTAIDDFGTGYSSLAWLRQLPLDYLKLDHGMIHDIMNDERGMLIVRSIIALARALGLSVIAEGVEREEQRLALEAEGCDYFQGFLRSPPLDAKSFEAFANGNL